MKIEWDQPPAPRRNADSLWTKVKNSISVIKQTHDGPPPRTPTRGNSYSHGHHSASARSRSSSSHPHSSSSLGQRSRSAGPSAATRPARPYVTIATNGGPPQPVPQNGGQYYHSSSTPLGARPKVAHRATAPYSNQSPTTSGSGMRSPTSTPTYHSSNTSTPVRGRPGAPSRSSTQPMSGTNTNGGVMYNGKLIVGDPNEVNRYISSQKGIEKWLSNVK